MRQILPTTKKIIIVGATSGIGRELALLYLRAGHRVGVTGRRQELLESLRAEFPGQVVTACYDVMGGEGFDAGEGDEVAAGGVSGTGFAGDVVAEAGVAGEGVVGEGVVGEGVSGAGATGTGNRSQLASLVERLGGLDLLVYSSGYGAISEGLDVAIDDQTVGINVRGFLDTIHFGWEYFVRQGYGHLATISSIAAIRGSSRAPAYSATKAFQSNYFEGLYMKAKRMGLALAVTDIQPGFVATKMAQGEGLFWVAPVEKAALQIYRALERRRRKVYITRRWRLIAWLMRWMPGAVYHRVG